MEKQVDIPKLRFPGFTENWKIIEGDKVFETITNKNHNSDLPILAITQDYGAIPRDLIDFKISVADKSIETYKVVEEGDFIISLRSFQGGIEYSNYKGICSPAYIILRPFSEIVDEFFKYYFKTERYIKLLNQKIEGIRDGKMISFKYFSDAKLKFPSIPEQTRIASFLSSVDSKLQSLKKKKNLLEQYKKGIMQKIFSQQLRFKDENGNDFQDWEEKKLEDIIRNFIVPMRDKPKDLDGHIPWCRIEDFNGKYLLNSKSGQGVTMSTVIEMNLKIFPINTLLVSCSANLGFCSIVKKELITNQTFIGLVPDDKKVEVEFLYYIMRLSSTKLNVLSSGTTISYLSREQFEKFKISIPSLPEQTLIASFLSSIDAKISHTQTQIDKTETWKKGLLQQMFV